MSLQPFLIVRPLALSLVSVMSQPVGLANLGASCFINASLPKFASGASPAGSHCHWHGTAGDGPRKRTSQVGISSRTSHADRDYQLVLQRPPRRCRGVLRGPLQRVSRATSVSSGTGGSPAPLSALLVRALYAPRRVPDVATHFGCGHLAELRARSLGLLPLLPQSFDVTSETGAVPTPNASAPRKLWIRLWAQSKVRRWPEVLSMNFEALGWC